MPEQDRTGLSRLMYRSQSLLEGTAKERFAAIAAILDISRVNNARAGLTGVLLFDGAMFLQVVEGPMAELEQLYETIAWDPRHERIELIDLATIAARDYDSWNMAFVDGATHQGLQRFMTRKLEAKAAWLGDSVCSALKAQLLEAA